MTMTLSQDVAIDLARLLETRMLVQSTSGGGKSFALRRLLEQTAGSVQQLIIDPEGEFATLRERFDYIIAAPRDADAVATPKTANMLARRLLEAGVSAVLNIYDLHAHERQEFVRLFCEALVNAPKSLWHPCLVILDEAHVYAPEKGKAASTGAVIDLATRGRKRGFGLVLATQRLSKLHKDAAAEMLNKLIGRTGLDVDVQRAADELGVTPREAMTRLRALAPGQFYAFGPALGHAIAPQLVTIGPVQTTHPKSGARMLTAPPAPSAKILKVLGELEGIEREAQQEAQTVADLQRENAALKGAVTRLEKQANLAPAPRASVDTVPLAEVERRIDAAVAATKRAGVDALRSVQRQAFEARKALVRVAEIATAFTGGERAASEADSSSKTAFEISGLQAASSGGREIADEPPSTAEIANRFRDLPAVANARSETAIAGPEQRILNALAWLEAVGLPEPYARVQVAFIAGYKPGGGAFTNPLGALRTKGFIEYPQSGYVSMTADGRACAMPPEVAPTNANLQAAVLERLDGPQRRILQPLIDAYPSELSRHELAAKARYEPHGGAFTNPLGSLRTLGLIGYPRSGYVVALPVLFPKGLA